MTQNQLAHSGHTAVPFIFALCWSALPQILGSPPSPLITKFSAPSCLSLPGHLCIMFSFCVSWLLKILECWVTQFYMSGCTSFLVAYTFPATQLRDQNRGPEIWSRVTTEDMASLWSPPGPLCTHVLPEWTDECAGIGFRIMLSTPQGKIGLNPALLPVNPYSKIDTLWLSDQLGTQKSRSSLQNSAD